MKVKKVLVIGGMAPAINLRTRNVEADPVKFQTHWKATSAGITISKPTLRGFEALGLLEEVKRPGFYPHDVLIRAPNCRLLADLPTPPMDTDVPDSGGILHPVLAKLLSKARLYASVAVRQGATLSSIEQDQHRAEVNFTNDHRNRPEFVFGADGLKLNVRKTVSLKRLTAQFNALGCCRAVVPLPSEIPRPRCSSTSATRLA